MVSNENTTDQNTRPFLAHSKEHHEWVTTLKAGDEVDILRPWIDSEVKGGRRDPSVVEKVGFLANGVTRVIHVKDFGVFYASGARFNKILMPVK